MKAIAIISICLLFYPEINGQDLMVRGIIHATETGDIVPFVSISSKSSNVLLAIGNSSGEFGFNPLLPNDTLVFSCVGFEDYYIPAHNLSTTEINHISLLSKSFLLSEVVISPGQMKEEVLGIDNVPEKAMTFSYGIFNYSAFAHLYKLKNRPSRIESASIHIGKNNIGEFVLRCRITKTKQNNVPGNDLLEANLVVKSDISQGWVTFDLSGYDLWIDEKKVFLVIEVLQDINYAEYKNALGLVNTPGFSYVKEGGTLISILPERWLYDDRRIVSHLRVAYTD